MFNVLASVLLLATLAATRAMAADDPYCYNPTISKAKTTPGGGMPAYWELEGSTTVKKIPAGAIGLNLVFTFEKYNPGTNKWEPWTTVEKTVQFGAPTTEYFVSSGPKRVTPNPVATDRYRIVITGDVVKPMGVLTSLPKATTFEATGMALP